MIIYVQVFKLALKLLFAHCLADWGCLQSARMAKYKSRKEATPCGARNIWWGYWLTAHSIIYAGVMYLVYPSMAFAIVVAISHWIIDFLKCEGIIDIHLDQLLHIAFIAGYITGVKPWIAG